MRLKGACTRIQFIIVLLIFQTRCILSARCCGALLRVISTDVFLGSIAQSRELWYGLKRLGHKFT